ncbi:MAG TPA: hypothetical protein PKC28_12555 [Bdellovibrionales bacterium]|nr:hypothetical protein [Bdellovibrionales bacterium]
MTTILKMILVASFFVTGTGHAQSLETIMREAGELTEQDNATLLGEIERLEAQIDFLSAHMQAVSATGALPLALSGALFSRLTKPLAGKAIRFTGAVVSLVASGFLGYVVYTDLNELQTLKEELRQLKAELSNR